MGIEELIERLERLQGKEKYIGRERRKFARIVYPPAQRPILQVKSFNIEVVDVSERKF